MLSSSSVGRAAGHAIERPAGRCRSDARQKLQGAETGDAVARILAKRKDRQHVLDMRRFEKFQAAEFDERNVAPGQFDFQRPRMMGGAKQHRLLLERTSAFAIVQDRLHRIARLLGLVLHIDQMRPLGGGAVGFQILGEALGGKFDDGVGGGQDRPRRTVIVLERDRPRRAG